MLKDAYLVPTHHTLTVKKSYSSQTALPPSPSLSLEQYDYEKERAQIRLEERTLIADSPGQRLIETEIAYSQITNFSRSLESDLRDSHIQLLFIHLHKTH